MDVRSLTQRFPVQITHSSVISVLAMTTITALICGAVYKVRHLVHFNCNHLLTSFKIWIHSWKMSKYEIKKAGTTIYGRLSPVTGTPGYIESQLEWVRRRTRGEKNPKNLTSDWSNGITLCTLINGIEPGLCPRCDLLQPEQSTENVEKAIKILKNNLKVDPFLDAEKVVREESASAISYLLARLKIVSAKRNLRRALKKPLIQVTDETGRSKPAKLNRGECFAKGMGLQLAVVGRKARFNIFFQNASRLNLVVEIIGPNNSKGSQSVLEEISALWKCSNISPESRTIAEDLKKIAVTCEIISSQQVSVSYIPVQTGKHRLSVLWEDMHICGSPFTVHVDNSFETNCQTSPSETISASSPLCRFSSSRKIPLKTKILQKTLLGQVLVINGVERPFPTPGFVNLDHIQQNSQPEQLVEIEVSRSDPGEDINIDEVSTPPSSPTFEQDIICNYALTMNYSSYFPEIMDITTGPASLSTYLDDTIDHDAVNVQFEQLVRETSYYQEGQTEPVSDRKCSANFLKPPTNVVAQISNPGLRERKRTFDERKSPQIKVPPKPSLVVVQTSVKDRLKFWESLSTASEDKNKPIRLKISRAPKERKMEEVEPPTTSPDSEADSGIVQISVKPKDNFLKLAQPVAMRRSGSFPVVTPQQQSQECSMSVSNLQRPSNHNPIPIVESRPTSGFIDDDYDECLFSGSMATLSESRRSSKDVSRISLVTCGRRAYGSGLHYATVGLKSNFTVSMWITEIAFNFFCRLTQRIVRAVTFL